MIGVFDSGVGGLTVLKHIHLRMPQYDTMYLGDSLNAPYGTRTHEEIAELTWSGVEWLFKNGCPLVIVACNSASAQALRYIQQNKLKDYPDHRVLGIIIPTIEELSDSGIRHIGILGTEATISSKAYEKEFVKYQSKMHVVSHACPKWAPAIERGEMGLDATKQMIKADIDLLIAKDPSLEAILLGCTHYPVLIDQIEAMLPRKIHIFEQGPMVARRLEDYLLRRPEVDSHLEKEGKRSYFTTGSTEESDRISRYIGVTNTQFSSVDLANK